MFIDLLLRHETANGSTIPLGFAPVFAAAFSARRSGTGSIRTILLTGRIIARLLA